MSNPQEAAIHRKKSGVGIKYVAFVGVFAAIATVLMLFEIPLPFAPSFYQIDLSEVPVLIGAFALGPVAGVMIELIKILLHFVIHGTMTAGVGELANFIIGCALVVPAGLIYKASKTRKHAIVGMVVGTLTMSVVGTALNAYLLLPAYGKAFGMPVKALVAMGTAVNPAIHSLFDFCLLAVAPFNLLKGVIISVITMLLYKHVSRLIHSTGI